MPAGRGDRVILTVVHVVAFQVVWFACVLGAAHGSSGPGLAAGAAFLAFCLFSSRSRRAELLLITQAALLGLVLDSLLVAGGVLTFAAPAPLLSGQLAPPWILVLWASFATLAPRSLSWLQRRLGLAALLGALAGPVTYVSAARLGAAELAISIPVAAAAVAVEYGLAMPIVMALSRRLTPEPTTGIRPEAA